MKPERFGIALAPGGNILPVMKTWKKLRRHSRHNFLLLRFPKNKMNDWLVAEHTKRFKAPPDMFTAGGFTAASAVISALSKKSTETEKLIAAMEGMEFETQRQDEFPQRRPSGFLQAMYQF